MNKLLTIAALTALSLAGSARADATRTLLDNGDRLAGNVGPVRGSIGLARPVGGAAVVVGRGVRPVRRAAWLGRSIGRGAGAVARGVGRAAVGGAKVRKPFRPFKRRVIIIP